MQSLRDNPTSLFGLSLGEKAYFTSAIPNFTLYIASDYFSSTKIYNQLSHLTSVALLPPIPDTLTYKQGASDEIFHSRINALCKLLSGQINVLIISAQSLAEKFPQKEDFLNHTLKFTVNKSIDLSKTINTLIKAGYRRLPIASEKGSFSLRGDILDIFPLSYTSKPHNITDEPLRIELFGDDVESIMTYSPQDQTRQKKLSEVVVYPATEFFIDDETLSWLKKEVPKKKTPNLPPDARARQDRIIEDLMLKLDTQNFDNTILYISYLLSRVSISNYLPENSTVLYDETKTISDSLNILYKEHSSRAQLLYEQGEVFSDAILQYTPYENIFDGFKNHNLISFHIFNTANRFFDPKTVISFHVSPMTRYAGSYEELIRDLRAWQNNGYRILLAAKNSTQAVSLQALLRDKGLYIPINQTAPDDFLESGKTLIIEADTGTGSSWHNDKFLLIGCEDLFPRRNKLSPARAKDAFFEVKAGDFVVHYIHGIGKCLGIERMHGILGTKDYIIIEYRDGDKLFVPTEQTDMLSRFSGEDPKLSKIGGAEFSKVKQRVKEGIKQMAFSLQKLYAERSELSGYKYEIDTELINGFEAAFPYQETLDQRHATDDILFDMQKGVVMDRLICGDVGYGKTEVAFRAAFATISAERQVAFLAPTTILSEQHYNTSIERMKDWGIKIEVLNRFKNNLEAKQILARLKNGEIDLLIGTHRLLSSDVVFKNLGLLILDEEQRFGVEDKEKIKLMRKNINVLTMSATPIPRTLHMSLSGIRDISLLNEPPADRLPVQTYVTEMSPGLLYDAIFRELARGGQVFVVYNRSETIDSFAAYIKRLVPDAIVEAVFGTMPEEKLSLAIKKFYDGLINVLVCTTIIENGIDLPMANTLIVCNADRFGLSQLYQLRGRVGRSNRLAYSYFTFEPDKELTSQAYKRLEALLEFTELGSGFKIAMRDLEIRGAGNVLGREQHGHMEKVGYELYAKLLVKVRQELNNEQVDEIEECRIETDTDAYIPDDFISDSSMRMRLYNKIALISSPQERIDVLNEIKDVFGSVPKVVNNLVNIGLYKGLGIKAGAKTIHMEKAAGEISFSAVTPALLDVVNEMQDCCVLKLVKKPVLSVKSDVYRNIYKILINLANKTKSK